MKTARAWCLLSLYLISGHVNASETTLTNSILFGHWESNCRFVESSDPTNPDKGTFQKGYWDFAGTTMTLLISIHQLSDSACAQKSIFEAKARYHYKLEENLVLSDQKEVTRISGTLLEENKLFDRNTKEILFYENNKLYVGVDQDADVASVVSYTSYPEKIDDGFFFTKQ